MGSRIKSAQSSFHILYYTGGNIISIFFNQTSVGFGRDKWSLPIGMNWSPAPDLIPKHVLYIPNSFVCYYCIWLWIQNQLFNLQYCGVLIQIISISMNLLKDHNGWQEVVIEAGFHVVVWMGKNWYTWLRSKFMVNCLDEQNEFSTVC